MIDNRSHRYQLLVYRNPETVEKEYILADFLEFCDRESENVTDEEVKHIQKAITEYLGYTLQQVHEAEKSMLARWIG